MANFGTAWQLTAVLLRIIRRSKYEVVVTIFDQIKLDLSRESWILLSFAVLTTFGVSAIFPYIPLYAQEIGIPVSIIGYLVVIYYLIQAVARIPLGRISDIIGHRHPVLIGASLYLMAAIFFLLSYFAWYLLFVAEFFLGIANSITWVTIPSYLTNISGVMPLFTFALGLGWLVGPSFGGFIKDAVGMTWVFMILALVSLALVFLAILFYREQCQEASITDSFKSFFTAGKQSPVTIPLYPSLRSYVEGWRLLKTNKILLIASGFSFLVFMTFGLGASVVPLYFSEVGLASFFIGMLVSIRTATSTAIRLLTDKIHSKLGGPTTLIASTSLVGLSMILVSQTGNLPLLVLLSAFWGVSSGLYLPVVFQLISTHVSEENRGIAMGIRGTLGTTGAAFGTLVFSSFAQCFSLSLSLLSAGATAIVGSLLLSLLR